MLSEIKVFMQTSGHQIEISTAMGHRHLRKVVKTALRIEIALRH